MTKEHDNEHFLYDRSWVEIEEMLDRAERKMNYHETESHLAKSQQDKMYHIVQTEGSYQHRMKLPLRKLRKL